MKKLLAGLGILSVFALGSAAMAVDAGSDVTVNIAKSVAVSDVTDVTIDADQGPGTYHGFGTANCFANSSATITIAATGTAALPLTAKFDSDADGAYDEDSLSISAPTPITFAVFATTDWADTAGTVDGTVTVTIAAD